MCIKDLVVLLHVWLEKPSIQIESDVQEVDNLLVDSNKVQGEAICPENSVKFKLHLRLLIIYNLCFLEYKRRAKIFINVRRIVSKQEEVFFVYPGQFKNIIQAEGGVIVLKQSLGNIKSISILFFCLTFPIGTGCLK